jgi:UDP-MurNAc hydroxylase
MQITFINHASFLLETADIQLIIDPWIEGTVFYEGWSLLAPTAFSYADFQQITHIWFSHEHPDHFFPPNLKKIPADIRKKMTVLYRMTQDKKVIDFCAQLGFKTIELPIDKWYALNSDLNILCHPHHDDSTMIIQSSKAQKTILNTNDCVLAHATDLNTVQQLAGKVDVLLTQFSYASYVGETFEDRQKQAARKLIQMQAQIEAFQPTFIIPFASFVWFCHAENVQMNDAINKITTVYDWLSSFNTVNPIIMYPADSWQIGEPFNSEPALTKWGACYERIHDSTLIQSKPLTFNQLQSNFSPFRKRWFEKLKFLRLFTLLNVVKPVKIYLRDLHICCLLDVQSKQLLQMNDCADYDIWMSSDVLNYCLLFDYGFGTTHVNGRFGIQSELGYKKFKNYIYLGEMANHGRFEIGDLLATVKRRFYRMLGKK